MLRDNRARARAARLVFLLYMLTTAAVAVLSLLALGLPDWSRVGSGNASVATNLLMGLYGLLLVGQFLLVVATYVVFILWLRRAYYNLHQLPTMRPEYSDGWAAGAWFVPFINLVRPYTITREVWNDTQRAAWGRITQPATILGWWWAAYLVKVVMSQATGRVGATITPSSLTLLLANAVASFIFAALTWYVIGRGAAFEEELTLRQQVNQLGQPAPPAAPPDPHQSDYALAEGY